jgi:hypothetical protein
MGAKWREYVKEGLASQQAALGRIPGAGHSCHHQRRALLGIAYIKFVKQYRPWCPMLRSTNISPIPTIWRWELGATPERRALYISTRFRRMDRMISQDGELCSFPGVYPPIQGAEKVTPNMVPMDNPTEEEAKSLSNEFRQIFFAK